MLLFTGFLPLLIIDLSLGFGLIFLAALWGTMKASIGLLAITATLVGNVMIVLGLYVGRHKIRERELLARLRTTIPNKRPLIRLSPQLQAILMSTVALALILFLIFALIKFDVLWALTKWLLFEPLEGERAEEQYPQLTKLKERLVEALPLILMGAYIASSLALTYFSSALSAQEYAGRMNRALPQPIFLQGDLLARVVKREAEKYLRQIQAEHSADRDTTRENGGWVWADLERTGDGGIKFLARAECEDSRVEESITGHRTKFPEFVDYTIEADRWGRVIRVTRGERTPPY